MNTTKTLAVWLLCLSALLPASAAEKFTVTLAPNDSAPVIAPEIYGQFAEHLGRCIYGGIWVGEGSGIPNTRGYRNDVLQAFKDLQIPVLRWPGGCFADEYHWVDGIGPRENRPRMVNTNWGGTVEDNSFGTHEFFDLCELIGAEPYLSGNVGSGTVEELAKWVEYITAEDGPMAKKRKENGREKPWKLKYLGVGNESWGCGGNFTPEAYANEYRRYQTYCRDYGSNRLYRVASGASDYDYRWTDVLMKNARRHMQGLSLHYYTVKEWNHKGSATDFDADSYYTTLGKAVEIDSVIRRHSEVMDKYDPEKRVGLLVDEWGTWWDVEPGTNPGHLYQQNTMRDAMVAALSLNIFHNHTDRVRMANIAQIANVLQAMVLTRDAEMVLTPTYHVFRLYIPHQGARHIPLTVDGPTATDSNGRPYPLLSATASEKDGKVTVSLANTSLTSPADVTIPLADIKISQPNGVEQKSIASRVKDDSEQSIASRVKDDSEQSIASRVKSKDIKAEILTSADVHDLNDFDAPDRVKPEPFKDFKLKNNTLTATLPPLSIVTLTL